MRDYLINIIKRLEIPEYAHKPLLDAFGKISDKADIDFVLSKYEDENVEFRGMISDWHDAISKKYNIPERLSALLFSLLMCKKCEEIYESRKLPKELFIHTMKGITYSIEECRLVKKEIGTNICWWFDDFFRLRRFAFGRLQFEYYHFSYSYKDDKYDFNPYTPCVNVHIPRSGERIDPAKVDESFDLADKFFKPWFNNQPIIYRCESWALHTSALKLCSPESNIGMFQKRFNIFHQKDDPDISELWRLFDEEVDINNLDKLKTDTSLRRKYIEYVKNGGKFGEGTGFFIR